MASTLMEVRHADSKQEITLSAYADTIILDGDTLVGIRIGGYPEMVSGLSAAIYGGAALDITADGIPISCKADAKRYTQSFTYDGVYTVAEITWKDDVISKKTEKKNDNQAQEELARKLYIFCPVGDRDTLYRELDQKSIVPMIPEFQSFLLEQLWEREILRPCNVRTAGTPFEVWRLDLTADNQNIVAVVEAGLKSGEIQIPGADAAAKDAFQEINGVTNYLNRFGSTLAKRIRNQFNPLYDPESEPLTDAVCTVNAHIQEKTRYSLFNAQLAAAEALKRRLQLSKFALLIAECGSGKTKIGSTALEAYQSQTGGKHLNIVLCPSHITDKWVRELGETIPNVFAAIVDSPEEFDALYEHHTQNNKTTYAVISKETARDGYMRRPAAKWNDIRRGFLCPDCGRIIHMEFMDCGTLIRKKADARYFLNETAHNHKCEECGTVLWTATHAGEQSEWVKIGMFGFVHRRFAFQSLQGCKLPSARKQIEELVVNPHKKTIAKGALRRFSLSTYIKNRYTGRIDALIADELHQYAANSGQGDSMGELYAAAEKFIGMTATLINGYASGLFYLLYRVCSSLMQQDNQKFQSPTAFCKEYGVIETTYTMTESAYNSNRRTVKRKAQERQRPGVSPLVYARFLLENAVFLSLMDMGKDLPEYEEIPVPIALPPEIFHLYLRLETELREVLKNHKQLAQKILSTYLNLLMAYPDQPYGHPPVISPADGTVLVEPQDAVTPEMLNAKDQYVLDLARRKVKNGEKVLLYVNWVRLDSREKLCKLLNENGIRTEIMDDDVPPRQREKWVETHLQQGMQVMITNPQKVETGLDLNDFTTLVFYDIAFKLFTFRQASRRSWRINQTAPRIEVYILYFNATMQARAVELMASKLAVAGVIEGNLSDEGLAALSNCQDLSTILARELASGIRDTGAVEDIAASFKRMAILHTDRQPNEQVQTPAQAQAAQVDPIIFQTTSDQLSLWDLVG